MSLNLRSLLDPRRDHIGLVENSWSKFTALVTDHVHFDLKAFYQGCGGVWLRDESDRQIGADHSVMELHLHLRRKECHPDQPPTRLTGR